MDEQNINQVDTKQETDKKCPACGGTMNFDPQTGGLLCPYCGHAQEITEQSGSAQEQDFSTAEADGNCNWGVEKKTVICKSCGAESIYDALQVSDVCPYCGSNQVMDAAEKDTLAPGGVCTFAVSAKQAGERFVKWIKGKWFCPSAAKKSAKPDAFKGVYLPYWTFDTDTFSTYTGRYGRDKTVRDKDGNTSVETDWYPCSGEYARFIDDQLTIATTRHDAAILRQIEPFDTADNKAYKPEYVAGFISERYSIDLKRGWENVKPDIESILRSEIEDKIRCDHNADHGDVNSMFVNYGNIKYKYLMLPIWLSSFKYKSKIYQFVVNGQTGKVGGKTPISALRVTIAVLIVLALLALVMIISQNS